MIEESFLYRVENTLENKHIGKFEFCDNLNLSHNTFSNWRKQKTIPAADVAVKIADYLNVSVEWLVTGKESEYSPEEKELVETWRQLNNQQKQSLKILLDGYSKQNESVEKKSFV